MQLRRAVNRSPGSSAQLTIVTGPHSERAATYVRTALTSGFSRSDGLASLLLPESDEHAGVGRVAGPSEVAALKRPDVKSGAPGWW